MGYWKSRLFPHAAKATRKRRCPPELSRRALQLEPLEDRRLLSSSPSSLVDVSELLAATAGTNGLAADEIQIQMRQIGEAGTFAVDPNNTAQWHTIQLERDYADPVVVASPVSSGVARPAMVRVQNVQRDSFQFQIDAWDYAADGHGPETIGYVVLEAGRHTLDDGTLVEAGTLGLVRHAWTRIRFGREFEEPPVVLTQAVTANDPAAVVTRQRYVTTSGLQLRLQEEEGADGIHGREVVSYIAIDRNAAETGDSLLEVGTTPSGVTDPWQAVAFGQDFEAAPVLLANAQTFNNADPIAVRLRNLGASGADLMLAEEQSLDSETQHPAETVGYVLFEPGSIEITLARPAELTIGEVGSVSRSFQTDRDTWHQVTLSRDYVNPVVIMSPASTIGTQPVNVRVRNVGTSRFEYQLDEWDYTDGRHPAEEIGYLVLEAGRHELSDGTIVEAGTISPVRHLWKRYSFFEGFDSAPAVLTQVMTYHDDAAVVVRHQAVTGAGFKLRLQEEQAADIKHDGEMVGYLAIERGTGTTGEVAYEAGSTPEAFDWHWNPLNYQASYSDPVLLASVRTTIGGDPIVVRYTQPGSSGVQLRLQEERSYDKEVVHLKEGVDYAVFEPGLILARDVRPFSSSIGESGVVTVAQPDAQTWHTVQLQRSYRDPVVVMTPPSSNDAAPIAVRVRNIQAGSFEFQLDEWDYLNGAHATESVGYLVVEAGRHVLDDSTVLEAGTLAVVNQVWRRQIFSQTFAARPVVVTQTVSHRDAAAAVTRLRKVSLAGFDVRLQEEEAADGTHLAETVSYVAIGQAVGTSGGTRFEFGTTSNPVDSNGAAVDFQQTFAAAPVLLAAAQTTDNADPFTLRYSELDARHVELRLAEERSLDSEIGHPAESVGYALLEPGPLRVHAAAAAANEFSGQVVDLAILEVLGAVHVIREPVDDEPPPPFAAYYDFGTANSPVSAGYTRVSNATRYTSGRGFGWLQGAINSADRNSSTTLVRDLNYTRDGTFAVDVPNGTYRVDLILGDEANVRHDGVGIYLEGKFAGKVTTAGGKVIGRGYTTEITDGQLNLHLLDLAGNDPHAAIEALRVYTAGIIEPAVTGPWWPLPPDIPGGFFYDAVRSGGYEIYSVDSAYQKNLTKIRVLTPNKMVAGREYRVVYVLPVEPGERHDFGDGLATVRRLNLHNRHNVIFVAPTFSDMPWYADHVNNRQVWQETHFRTVVVPLIEEQYPVVDGAEGRLLLGFSKSGYGSFTMLLRHPDVFARAVAWDAPLAMSNPSSGYGFTGILGSTQNFQNFRVTTLLRQRKALLRSQPPRLLLLGYGDNSHRQDHQAVHQLMNDLGIPHVFRDGPHRSHHWDSGWVGDAVARLLG